LRNDIKSHSLTLKLLYIKLSHSFVLLVGVISISLSDLGGLESEQTSGNKYINADCQTQDILH